MAGLASFNSDASARITSCILTFIGEKCHGKKGMRISRELCLYFEQIPLDSEWILRTGFFLAKSKCVIYDFFGTVYSRSPLTIQPG